MIRTILVPATGSAADIAAYTTAREIAQGFGAHIDVLHVRVDPVTVAVSMAADPAGGTMVEGVIEQLERDAAQHESEARRRFDEFCAAQALVLADAPAAAASPSATAQWHVETGDEARHVAAYGMAADLVVAARGDADGGATRSLLETALLETGRPLLIPGGAASPGMVGGTVAIGWKAAPQAVRAVAAAMPLLARAREVVVMTVDEEGGPDTDRLIRHLAWHGIRARAERLAPGSGNAPEILLSAAAAQAGLLVMGGYGHSRVREWAFGGFTQRVLEHAPLPVLLAH